MLGSVSVRVKRPQQYSYRVPFLYFSLVARSVLHVPSHKVAESHCKCRYDLGMSCRNTSTLSCRVDIVHLKSFRNRRTQCRIAACWKRFPARTAPFGGELSYRESIFSSSPPLHSTFGEGKSNILYCKIETADRRQAFSPNIYECQECTSNCLVHWLVKFWTVEAHQNREESLFAALLLPAVGISPIWRGFQVVMPTLVQQAAALDAAGPHILLGLMLYMCILTQYRS